MARRRFQKGSIRKRGKRNPIWELQYWIDCINPDGSIGRKRESKILGYVSDLTKKQAHKLAQEFLQPVNTGKITPFSMITLREFVEGYFVPIVFPILKASTGKHYRITFNKHLLPAFGEYRLCDIRTLDLQRFILEKSQGGASWEAVSHFRNLVSKVYSMARKWGHFAGENPASGVDLPPKTAVREKHVLGPEQFRSLLVRLKEPVRTMAFLAMTTGLRVGEILGLRWQDVELTKRQLTVSQSIYRGTMGTPKTKSSCRVLPLPECLVNELEAHYRRSGYPEGPQLVFRTGSGTPYNDTNLLHRHIKPAGKAIGAPWLSWHVFRRTHCTLFQLAGGSLKDAQAQLGHASAVVTMQHYTVSIPGHQRQAIENLAELVTNGDDLRQGIEPQRVYTEQIQ